MPVGSNDKESLNVAKLVLSQLPATSASVSKAKMFVAISNAESMNDIFPEWVRRAYLGTAAHKRCYRPYDLNMPIVVLGRSREAHKADSPLTEFGKICASLCARDLCQANILPKQIFCSPELRSIETALTISKRLNEENGTTTPIPVLVDASLCEWRNFDEQQIEKHWLTVEQCIHVGYFVDSDYTPVRTIADLASSETPQQYLDRLVEFLAKVYENSEGCSVIVGSGGMLNLMRGKCWRSGEDLQRIRSSTPSCSLSITCIPSCAPNGKCSHPLRPFTHCLSEAQQKRDGLLGNRE